MEGENGQVRRGLRSLEQMEMAERRLTTVEKKGARALEVQGQRSASLCTLGLTFGDSHSLADQTGNPSHQIVPSQTSSTFFRFKLDNSVR